MGLRIGNIENYITFRIYKLAILFVRMRFICGHSQNNFICGQMLKKRLESFYCGHITSSSTSSSSSGLRMKKFLLFCGAILT